MSQELIATVVIQLAAVVFVWGRLTERIAGLAVRVKELEAIHPRVGEHHL